MLTFSELPVHLSSKNVEQICWTGHVSNLHIAVLMLSIEFIRRRENSGIFVAELQVSFHAT